MEKSLVAGIVVPHRRRAKRQRRLGIELRTIAIEPAHQALMDMLAPSFTSSLCR